MIAVLTDGNMENSLVISQSAATNQAPTITITTSTLETKDAPLSNGIVAQLTLDDDKPVEEKTGHKTSCLLAQLQDCGVEIDDCIASIEMNGHALRTALNSCIDEWRRLLSTSQEAVNQLSDRAVLERIAQVRFVCKQTDLVIH